MASKSKTTRAQTRIAKAAPATLRKLTKSELEKLGYSPKSERYIEIGKRIWKNAVTISKRAFTTKVFGAPPEALAAARAEGRIPYRSKATQAAAEKQKITRAKKPLAPATVDAVVKKARKASTSGVRVTIPEDVHAKRGRKGLRPRSYNISDAQAAKMPDLIRRKMEGAFLDDGEWHQMVDFARAANLPHLNRLLIS